MMENKIDRACGTYGGEETCVSLKIVYNFLVVKTDRKNLL